MIRSVGRLHYSEGQKLVVDVDPEIVYLYRALAPKAIGLRPQKWPPHITVVRNELVDSLAWARHQDELVEFAYEPAARNDDRYYWLNVICERLKSVRLELGLPASSEWSRPPDGSEHFHITIGNTKQ